MGTHRLSGMSQNGGAFIGRISSGVLVAPIFELAGKSSLNLPNPYMPTAILQASGHLIIKKGLMKNLHKGVHQHHAK